MEPGETIHLVEHPPHPSKSEKSTPTPPKGTNGLDAINASDKKPHIQPQNNYPDSTADATKSIPISSQLPDRMMNETESSFYATIYMLYLGIKGCMASMTMSESAPNGDPVPYPWVSSCQSITREPTCFSSFLFALLCTWKYNMDRHQQKWKKDKKKNKKRWNIAPRRGAFCPKLTCFVILVYILPDGSDGLVDESLWPEVQKGNSDRLIRGVLSDLKHMQVRHIVLQIFISHAKIGIELIIVYILFASVS